MPKKSHVIYTIGYEGATADNLANTLAEAGVELLIDVRAVPLSRKPGFSKNKLAARLKENGIAYLGLRGLGTPAAGRTAARKGRITEMREIFTQHLGTDDAQIDLAEALKAAEEQRACLLCFEHHPQACHRLVVAERMAEQTGFEIIHLNPVVIGTL